MPYESSNSDVTLNGKTYHVQTEVWGPSSLYIVTQIFSDGNLLEIFKVRYENRDVAFLEDIKENQHTKVLSFLNSSFF